MQSTKTWRLMPHRIGSIALAGAIACTLPACSAPQQTATPTQESAAIEKEKPAVDTSGLVALMEQSKIDIDEYEFDSAMIAYTQAVSKHSHLIYDESATQDDVDKAVEEITSLREAVVNAGSTQDESDNTAQDMSSESNASDLPPFSEVSNIETGTVFEFSCSAKAEASARAGTHYVFTATYGDSDAWDEYANMDMNYKKYKDDIERGTRLRVRCKYIDADYKGAPNFEVIWYRVEDQK